MADRALAEARARAQLATAADPEPARLVALAESIWPPHSELAVARGTVTPPQAPVPAGPAATTAAAHAAAEEVERGGKGKDSGKKGDKGKKGKNSEARERVQLALAANPVPARLA